MRHELVLLAVLVLGFLGSSSLAAEREIRLATSATVQDSGLLNALLPEFSKDTGVKVRVIAVSPEAALALAAEGAADVVLADSPAAEDALLKSRTVLLRKPLLEDYFLIAGPANDPAKVREASNGADALRRIAAAKAPYLSLGRDTAAHTREHALLKTAGLKPDRGWPGFAHSDATPVETLRLAGEKRAYTLTDIGAFMAAHEGAKLERLTKAADDLRNVYSLLPVNPEKFPGKIQGEAANTFVEWCLRSTTSRKIAEYGVEKWGEPYFRPLSLAGD